MVIEMLKIHNTVIALVLMTGMVAAQPADTDLPAAGMTPGDLFYGLERASEKLELAFASAPVIGSDELAAKVRANHAAERLSEAKKLTEENKTEKVKKLMDQYSDSMNRSVQLARKSGKPEFAQRLKNVSQNQVQVLEDVRERVPEQARKGVENAIENSQKNQEKLDVPEKAKGPGKKPGNPGEAGKEGLKIMVEERAPEKQSPGKNQGKQKQENSSDRIELGRLPTERPDENSPDQTSSDGGIQVKQGSETKRKKELNDSLP